MIVKRLARNTLRELKTAKDIKEKLKRLQPACSSLYISFSVRKDNASVNLAFV